VRHALTIDVEDWYHDGGVPVNGTDAHRVERNADHLLELLDRHGARATWFVLGDVAERCSSLVRRVAAGGHEIASHGYAHRPLGQLLRSEFRADVLRSVRVLEDVSGTPVRGYRAPYFSIKAGVRWPIDTLKDIGLVYDSSVLGIDRPPGLELIAPRRPYRHENGLWEVPIAILQMLHFWYLPIASGIGLRMVPEGLLYRCVRRFERDVGAGVFYFHPWEIDPDSPTGPGRGRWLLRIGRHRLVKRLTTLLQRRSFAPIVEVFDELQAALALPKKQAEGGLARLPG
jgi:polysaccharide deacetylase family protein (PEP-CTERM system associated)